MSEASGNRPAHSHDRFSKKLYVIITEPVPAAGDRLAARAQHLEYQYKLECEGIMFAAGPFLDANDEPNGSGLFIYRAASLEAATEIARNDPFHRLGFRTFRIMPWRLSEGTLGIRVNYSAGTYQVD